MLLNLLLVFYAHSSDGIDLLTEIKLEAPAKPSEKYNRERHFGKWRKRDGCKDTRAVLLISTSSKPVQLNPSKCSVRNGEWYDPYTDSYLTDAFDIQIDHLVALRNAYYAGAHEWPAKKRCHYANYLENPYHLLVVSGEENSKKSDYGPALYLPPNTKYRCQFVQDVLKVKVIWELSMNKEDFEASAKVLKSCPASYRTISRNELVEEKIKSDRIPSFCRNFR